MNITKEVLEALQGFASDTNISELQSATISEISFASAKHFEGFSEDDRQNLVRITYAIFSGLAINMQILGITEDDLCTLIIDKQ